MKGYQPELSFSDEVSAKFHDTRGDETECVAFLASIAGNGPLLELAIGTGRIALPLASEGISVDGIDFSTSMVDLLRSKPGGKDLNVKIADFKHVDMDNQYSLIFIIWNSLFNLLTQRDQATCFTNVAKHLTSGGLFAIEVYMPSFLYRMVGDQEVKTEAIETDSVRLGVLKHDPVNQMLENSHVTLSATGTRFDPVVQRYAWPSELDLMANNAGLELSDRWSGWNREKFDADSARHISVYQKT
jgi:hypothetical protein